MKAEDVKVIKLINGRYAVVDIVHEKKIAISKCLDSGYPTTLMLKYCSFRNEKIANRVRLNYLSANLVEHE